MNQPQRPAMASTRTGCQEIARHVCCLQLLRAAVAGQGLVGLPAAPRLCVACSPGQASSVSMPGHASAAWLARHASPPSARSRRGIRNEGSPALIAAPRCMSNSRLVRSAHSCLSLSGSRLHSTLAVRIQVLGVPSGSDCQMCFVNNASGFQALGTAPDCTATASAESAVRRRAPTFFAATLVAVFVHRRMRRDDDIPWGNPPGPWAQDGALECTSETGCVEGFRRLHCASMLLRHATFNAFAHGPPRARAIFPSRSRHATRVNPARACGSRAWFAAGQEDTQSVPGVAGLRPRTWEATPSGAIGGATPPPSCPRRSLRFPRPPHHPPPPRPHSHRPAR